MAQTLRITLTPEIQQALLILRQSTMGTLTDTELIKLSIGEFAKSKGNILKNNEEVDITPQEMDMIGARQFYEWAKQDGSLNVDNIAHPEKLKPFVPKPYVRAR